MNIKTITCHNVYNHGAALQEFALLAYLEQEGHAVKAINYQPDYLANSYKIFKVNSPKWENNFLKRLIYITLKLPKNLSNLRRYKAFDTFNKKYIKETDTLYKTNSDIKKNLPDADAYICGIDQIWNTLFQNGKDLAFYLNFVPKEKLKISYAASFAIDSIQNNLKSFVKENVEKLDVVSVREKSGLNILEDLNIKNATQVLDPVFLMEDTFWDTIISERIEGDYILIYDFDSNEVIQKVALKIAKTNNLRIFALNKNIRYADQVYWSIGPDQFLALMKDAKFVLTNSFHAVAFSLIFNKEFFVFNRQEKINTRMKDLLSDLNIEERLISDAEEYKDVKAINYKIVNSTLDNLILNSRQFLKRALSNNSKL